MPSSYFELIHRHPLKEIKSDKELQRALDLVNELIDKSSLDRGEKEYLNVLVKLVQDYESRRFPLPDVSPVEILQFLIEQSGKSQTEIARESGIDESSLSLVLRGKRPISKSNVGKLSEYFKVSSDVFLVPFRPEKIQVSMGLKQSRGRVKA